MKRFLLVSGLLLLSTLANTAFAAQAIITKRIVVSVGDLKENQNLAWKKQICDEVYTLANSIVDSTTDVTCRSFDTKNFVDKDLQELSKKNDYHLRILRSRDGALNVDITNWNRHNESDFQNLSWVFADKATNKVTKEQAFTKAMTNLFFFINNELAFKAGLLVNGAEESSTIIYDREHGVFLDKKTKLPMQIEGAYTSFENESPRKKNYLRAGIELGAQFSAGLAWYYKNLVYNATDFDYSFREGLRKKANGSAILFDDNDKFANYGHEYAGVLYYQIARSNGMGSLESFLVSFGSSAIWETLEYHEVFSINDQIMTPLGGYVIGEATYQISCALLQKDSVASKALGYAINPVGSINWAFNNWQTKDKFSSQPDCKKERWSDISMYLGLEKGQKPYQPNAKNTYIVGINAEVVTIPNYHKEGSDTGVILDTSMVKFMGENNGGDGMGDLKVIAEIVSAAYHKKNLAKDAYGDLQGYEMVVGVGSAATWNDRGAKKGDPNEDFYGTINILGATAHASIFYHGYEIKAEFGFYGDFAMVKSYALAAQDGYDKDSSLNGQTSPIKRHGYYWGYGHSTLAAISVSKDRWTVGYNGQISSAQDINGRDRKQDEVTNQADFWDSIIAHRFYVTFRITKSLSLQVSYDITQREGSMTGRTTRHGTEHRTMGTLVYNF